MEGGTRLARAATASLARLFCVENSPGVRGRGLRGRGVLSGASGRSASRALVPPWRRALGERGLPGPGPRAGGRRSESLLRCQARPVSVSAPAGSQLHLAPRLLGGGSRGRGGARRAPAGSPAGVRRKVCSCSDTNFCSEIDAVPSAGGREQTRSCGGRARPPRGRAGTSAGFRGARGAGRARSVAGGRSEWCGFLGGYIVVT